MQQCRAVLSALKTVRTKPAGDIYIADINPFVRQYAGQHDLALALWESGDMAARELALRITDPARVTDKMLESWLREIDEWGLCDGFAGYVVRPSRFAIPKAHKWAERKATYEKRAGFALMALMAWSKNDFSDQTFIDFLPLIEKHAGDARLHVKKSVNWALRDIGKRNAVLNKHARACALRLQKNDDKNVRWVGSHRLHEITGRAAA